MCYKYVLASGFDRSSVFESTERAQDVFDVASTLLDFDRAYILFMIVLLSSHNTAMRMQINSAGVEEEAQCTNASYACTGSPLKSALKFLNKAIPQNQ